MSLTFLLTLQMKKKSLQVTGKWRVPNTSENFSRSKIATKFPSKKIQNFGFDIPATSSKL